MKEIIKPVTLVRQEFIDNLSELINNSPLPAFCIESILEKALDEVHKISIIQYEKEKKEYEESIQKEENIN